MANASIFGAFQVASHDALVVYEPAADPDFVYTTRQCNFVLGLDPAPRRRVLAKLPAARDAHVPEAVLLSGRGCDNYFHFLIEDLTKGYVIEQLPQLDKVPLIVSSSLYPQEFEALAVAMPGRRLIERLPGQQLDVDRLHVPSLMTFLPDCPSVPFWRGSAVRHDSLRWLRNRVLAACAPAPGDGSRVYIARRGARNIVNAAEIDALFEAHGFRVVDPARLSFAEQVGLFRRASFIAGPVGAAFSNLVFATPGARVLGIVSPLATRFSIFANIAAFAGCAYFMLPGIGDERRRGEEGRRPPIALTHGSFRVDAQALRGRLRAFLDLGSG